MTKEMKIEHYLLQLDRELQGLPVSQRAEIITEIKSHIHDQLEKDPGRGIDSVLQSLGAPRVVAEPYLMSRGIARSTGGNRGGRWLKWLAVGTVGFFGLIFVGGLMAIWYFSPLVKVDEEKGRVTLFGGLIDVNEKIGQVKIGDMVVNDDDRVHMHEVEIAGEEDLAGKAIKLIRIPFNTARLEIVRSSTQKFSWECETLGGSSLKPEIAAGILTLNLDQLNLAKCKVRIPSGKSTEIRGLNGHMKVEKPQDPLDIQLTNGKVNIDPDPSRVYDFEVKVKNGLQDFFPPSNEKGAVKLKVSVVNGLVKKE